MDKIIKELEAVVSQEAENAECAENETLSYRSAKLLSECRMAMQSLIDGDPDLGPEGLIKKHREWFGELLA